MKLPAGYSDTAERSMAILAAGGRLGRVVCPRCGANKEGYWRSYWTCKACHRADERARRLANQNNLRTGN